MSTDTVLDIFEKPGVPYSVTADAYSTSSIGAATPPVETAAVVNPHCGDGLPAPLNQPALAFSGTIPAQSYVEDIAITPLDISGYWTGGQAPRTYSVFSGTLPSGLTLDSATGIVSGTPPTPAAATPIVFRVTDSLGAVANSGSVNFTITSAGVNIATAFEVVLYSGNNAASRSIASVVDLSGGGLVVINRRNGGGGCWMFMSADGVTVKGFDSTSTGTFSAPPVTFSASGFAFTANTYNLTGANYTATIFKKTPKLLDVVTYTGDGTTGSRALSHALTVIPARMVFTRVDGTANSIGAPLYDLSQGPTKAATTVANFAASTAWNNTAPTTTQFTVGGVSTPVNVNAVPYMAVLWAHDVTAAGVIQSCNWTGNFNVAGPIVTLGWQPQFEWHKNDSGTQWIAQDSVRGLGSTTVYAYWGLANAETSSAGSGGIQPLSTGFQLTALSADFNGSAKFYNGLAIRAP